MNQLARVVVKSWDAKFDYYVPHEIAVQLYREGKCRITNTSATEVTYESNSELLKHKRQP
jgi:hypothetical protein